MTRTRQAWATAIEDGDYRISDLSVLMGDWEGSEEEAANRHGKELEARAEELHEVKEARDSLQAQLAGGPEWGNCRRGCPPSYLDQEGFCSPACRLGFPRGEYVTLPKELEIKGDSSSA